jgi:hypothetical protein
VDKECLETKVTSINGRFHFMLIWNGDEVLNEMACTIRADIGYCMRYMLRMYDKLGGVSLMADASRHRGKNQVPTGKVWYPSEIPVKE